MKILTTSWTVSSRAELAELIATEARISPAAAHERAMAADRQGTSFETAVRVLGPQETGEVTQQWYASKISNGEMYKLTRIS